MVVNQHGNIDVQVLAVAYGRALILYPDGYESVIDESDLTVTVVPA